MTAILDQITASKIIENITKRAERGVQGKDWSNEKYDLIEAQFLLAIYNGAVFKVDLNSLLLLDMDKRIECLQILEYDVLGGRHMEIHKHIENGSERFQNLAKYFNKYK